MVFHNVPFSIHLQLHMQTYIMNYQSACVQTTPTPILRSFQSKPAITRVNPIEKPHNLNFITIFKASNSILTRLQRQTRKPHIINKTQTILKSFNNARRYR